MFLNFKLRVCLEIFDVQTLMVRIRLKIWEYVWWLQEMFLISVTRKFLSEILKDSRMNAKKKYKNMRI